MSEAADFVLMTKSGSLKRELEAVLAEKKWRGCFAGGPDEAGKLLSGTSPRVFVGDTTGSGQGWPALFSALTASAAPPVVVLLSEDEDPGPAFQAFRPLIFHCLRMPAPAAYLRFVLEQALRVASGSRGPLESGRMCDPLTGLMNQNYLARRLTQEFKRAERYNYPLSLLVLTIRSLTETTGGDDEKRDHVLYDFSRFLIRFARGNDVVIRAGAEEFLLVLPDTYKEGALTFAERMLETLQSEPFGDPGHRVHLSVNAGLANYPGDGARSEQELLDLAHRALESAEREGGGRVFAFRSISGKDIRGIISRRGREEGGAR